MASKAKSTGGKAPAASAAKPTPTDKEEAVTKPSVTSTTATTTTLLETTPDIHVPFSEPLLGEDLSTARVVLVGTTLLSVATFGFYSIPGLLDQKEQGQDAVVQHLVDAFYCAAITLSTVGYGDICPVAPGMEAKLFLLGLSFAGMGFFCGPILSLGGTWRRAVPGGLPAWGTFIVGLGAMIFTNVEGMDHFDAIYASIITGTTVGYGDATPQTAVGKIAVALYAILSVNSIGMYVCEQIHRHTGAMALSHHLFAFGIHHRYGITPRLLDPARVYFENLCRRPPLPKTVPQSKDRTKQD